MLGLLGINPGLAIALDSAERSRRASEESSARRKRHEQEAQQARESHVQQWLDEPGCKGQLVVTDTIVGIRKGPE